MDVKQNSPILDEHSVFTVLVTGANSGLGFAICCRTIDEFLFTRPQTESLHLLFSTRDSRKSKDTERRLRKHLAHTLRKANGTTLGISLLLEKRITIEGVQCDLTRLTTVKALAEDLLRRRQKLDALIWNAGIGGWTGLNWPKAIWHILTDLIHASIYPEYNLCDFGALAPRQLERQEQDDEPSLGQVFTANVFGHYMLTHWLAPLMDVDSRIVWISSITAQRPSFNLDDFQGLRSNEAYESSKRLTDLLVLNSELPSTRTYVDSFLPSQTSSTTGQQVSYRPKMYVAHPGICGTSIAGLNWFLEFCMYTFMYLARLLGSPWHLVSAYKGSISAVFAALAPFEQLAHQEQRDGKGKWGSAINVSGDERIARTEVEGWGYCGIPGVVPNGSVTGSKGRWRGMHQTGKEEREEFERVGAMAWRDMEELRQQWENRLGPVGLIHEEDA